MCEWPDGGWCCTGIEHNELIVRVKTLPSPRPHRYMQGGSDVFLRNFYSYSKYIHPIALVFQNLWKSQPDCWSPILFGLKNNILGSLLCLKTHAVEICMPGIDRHHQVCPCSYFLYMHFGSSACRGSASSLRDSMGSVVTSLVQELWIILLYLWYFLLPCDTFCYWIDWCNTCSILWSRLPGSFQSWIFILFYVSLWPDLSK